MIYSWSKFNYGHTVTTENKYIPFDEGGAELLAEVEPGSYSFSEFASAVEAALNAAGALTYTVSIERATGLITIAASGTFSLLTNSGSVTATTFELLGFSSDDEDLTGDVEYKGTLVSGSVYRPQFLLQSYVAPENKVESVEATVNQSADGRVEVVRFGTRNMIEMDIKFITNLTMDGLVIKSNPQGLSDARAFLNDITQKRKFEFVPDVADPATFYKVLLERCPGYQNGTGYKLKEMISENLPDIYETGVIELRVVS